MFRISINALFFILLPMGLWAQTDAPSVSNQVNSSDSLTKVNQDFERDSLKRIADSLTYFWIKTPDPNRKNQFRDSLMKYYQVYNLDFESWAKKFIKPKAGLPSGQARKTGETWILWVILILIAGFALLRIFFQKEIALIIRSFYDNRLLNQSGITSFLDTWPFVLLYLLFGLTIGMYLFLAGRFFQLDYAIDGFQWYLLLSFSIMVLFSLKIYFLRLLGFLLEINKLIKLYSSILYLSYFHAAILFLPLIFAFSLSPISYSEAFIYIGLASTALLLAYQAIRLSLQVLKQYSFSKFYLFIYFCALEICPILMLVKALRF